MIMNNWKTLVERKDNYCTGTWKGANNFVSSLCLQQSENINNCRSKFIHISRCSVKMYHIFLGDLVKYH